MPPRERDAGAARVANSLARALMLIHTGRAGRRVDLTEQLGLTRTATGAVLRELEELALAHTDTAPHEPSSGATTGRPSHAIEIHADAPTVTAVQVQAETVLIAEVGLGGRLASTIEVPLPRPATPEAVLGVVADQLAPGPRTGARVGLALPSAVADDGTALAALNLSWPAEVPVGRILTELLADRGAVAARVHVGNDANLGALAESRHGAGRGARHLLYLTAEQRGVRGGLVVDGRLHTGSAGYALEVGHLTVAPGGRPCHCGNSGCLEVEADAIALLRAAGPSGSASALAAGAGGEGPVLAAARKVAAATDARSRAAVSTITEHLAIGLATLVNVLNPDRIVLDGLYADLLAAARPRLGTSLARNSFLDQAAHVDLSPAELDHPTLIGAAELAFQPLLDDPRCLR